MHINTDLKISSIQYFISICQYQLHIKNIIIIILKNYICRSYIKKKYYRTHTHTICEFDNDMSINSWQLDSNSFSLTDSEEREREKEKQLTFNYRGKITDIIEQPRSIVCHSNYIRGKKSYDPSINRKSTAL